VPPLVRPLLDKALVVRHQRYRRGALGFTLVEAMVVTIVLAVLMLVVMPPFFRYLARAQVEQTARQTQTLLHKARHQAIRLRVPTAVRPDGETIVGFVDPNGDRVRDAGERSIGHVPMATQVTLTSPAAISFASDGSADFAGGITDFAFANPRGDSVLVRVKVTGFTEMIRSY